MRRRLVDNRGLLSPELLGSQFGSLTIIGPETLGSTDKLRVRVKCSRCQMVHMALFHNIRKRPNTKACPFCNPRKVVLVPHWLYRRCQAQQSRCNNPSDKAYPRYGGRGIKFLFTSPNAAACWIADNLGVANPEMQLDRIDNNGHYEPGNLRWTDAVVNMNNTRRNKGGRERFVQFRINYPHIKYADRTLKRLISIGLTDKEIVQRWEMPSHKPKGKYGTFSMRGLYKGSPLMDC